MQSSIILGVDIGGSHITSALVDLDHRKILQGSFNREKINSAGSAEAIKTAWAEVLTKSLKATSNSKIVGIAMPGPFDYQNGISYISGLNKYDSLYNLNIKELLIQWLYPLVEEILFVNDAACFLQGEVFAGAGKRYNKILGLTLGTGFGSATFENNLVLNADYWNFPFLDSICEDFFSSSWFIKRHLELTSRKVLNVKEIVENITNFHAKNDIFDEFSENLANLLTGILKEKDYNAIIFGGNISQASGLFLPRLKKNLEQRLFKVDLLVSELGEDAALIGAASFVNSFKLNISS